MHVVYIWDHFLKNLTLAAILEIREILKNFIFKKFHLSRKPFEIERNGWKFGTPRGIMHVVYMLDHFLKNITLAAILEIREILKMYHSSGDIWRQNWRHAVSSFLWYQESEIDSYSEEGEKPASIVGNVGLKTLAQVIHPYPTQAEAIRKVADAYNRTRLTPTVQNLFQKWFEFSRSKNTTIKIPAKYWNIFSAQ